MASPFVGEIRIFARTEVTLTGWAQCNGQLLPISQNTALFSLLGTYYGGDGKSTFALPDLTGRAAMGEGQGSGLSERFLGEMAGSENVTLLTSEMPAHPHTINALNTTGTSGSPTGKLPAKVVYSTGTTSGVGVAFSDKPPNVQLAPEALSVAGSSMPHNNMQPYLTLNFCIAMQGVFPPRG